MAYICFSFSDISCNPTNYATNAGTDKKTQETGGTHLECELAFTGESYRLRHALSQLHVPDDVGGAHPQQNTIYKNDPAQ